jgi:hypothetical protein
MDAVGDASSKHLLLITCCYRFIVYICYFLREFNFSYFSFFVIYIYVIFIFIFIIIIMITIIINDCQFF